MGKGKYQHHFIRVTILIGAIVLSFLLGNYVGSKDQFTAKEPCKSQSCNKIAVVDLDDGVEVGKEKKYYSKEIIELPNLNFVYTGLGDARSGFKDGTYGAYIIIPSTFSKCVSSINTNPTKAKFEFEIRNDLEGDTKSDIIYDLLKFEKKVNNDLSYVYVNNILKEFHAAQDISKTVMNNDLKERQAILEIKPNDLVEIIDIPELERIDNTSEQIDFSNYISKNQNIISDIDNEYKRQIEINLNGIYGLRDEGKDLIGELNAMISAVGQVDLLIDENGKVVYEDGANNFKNKIRDYNTALLDNKEAMEKKIENISEKQKEIEKILLGIEYYNNAIEDSITENKSCIKKSLSNLIPETNINMSETKDNLEISYGIGKPSINIGIESIDGDNYKLKIKEKEEDIRNFQNYTGERIEEFEPDIKINKIDYDVSEVIKDQEKNIEEINKEISKIEKIKDTEINEIIKSGIIKPLELQADNIKEDYNNRNTIEKDLIGKYGNSINVYNPIDNALEIENKMSVMNNNTVDLSNYIDNNNEKYLAFVDGMSENSEKNTNILIENMQDATEKSEKKVIAGLENAQNIKNSTSKANQDLLNSFSKKLGYTRLGSLEYIQVHDFIVNPVNMKNSDKKIEYDSDMKEETIDNDFEESSNEHKIEFISKHKVLFAMSMGLIFLLVIYIINR